LLEATGLTVRIDGNTLVDGLSLALEPGHLLAVVGPNGAGKSTLLRALSGEVPLAAGSVALNGRWLSDWSAREQARLRAVLPQTSTLTFAFRVLEVVLMGRTPHIHGVEQPRDYEISLDALETVVMRDFAERSYTTLSGGEGQRVQLARVLAQIWEESPLGPRYLLLDEPTNNLDLAHQHRTLQIAPRKARRGVGVLATLHDLNLAAQYADSVLIMKAGEGVATGSPDSVLTPEIIEEVFETRVVVLPHPCLNCPLIVSTMAIDTTTETATAVQRECRTGKIPGRRD